MVRAAQVWISASAVVALASVHAVSQHAHPGVTPRPMPQPTASPISDPLTQTVLALLPRLVAEEATVREKAEAEAVALGPRSIQRFLRIAREADVPVAEAIKRLLPRFGPAALPAICSAASGVSEGFGVEV